MLRVGHAGEVVAKESLCHLHDRCPGLHMFHVDQSIVRELGTGSSKRAAHGTGAYRLSVSRAYLAMEILHEAIPSCTTDWQPEQLLQILGEKKACTQHYHDGKVLADGALFSDQLLQAPAPVGIIGDRDVGIQHAYYHPRRETLLHECGLFPDNLALTLAAPYVLAAMSGGNPGCPTRWVRGRDHPHVVLGAQPLASLRVGDIMNIHVQV